MAGAIAMGALAIDVAISFVHDRHLQTQADAAAFAGADVMAQGYINGADCATINAAVKATVNQYDGTIGPYNTQAGPNVNGAGTPDSVVDQINRPQFNGQSLPNPGDTGLTGKPCEDSAVDVKMTETNVPSFLNPFSAPHLNKQAQVQAQLVQQANSAPFVLPNVTAPTDVAVFAVSEDPASPALSTDTVLASLGNCSDGVASPCLTSSNSGATWSAGNVPLAVGTRPVSLVVAKKSSAFTSAQVGAVTSGAALASLCSTSGVSCYDGSDGTGLTYTRAYSTSASANFPSTAPVVQDTYLSDPSSDATVCQSSGSTSLFTGFIAANSTCTLNFSANLNFGSAESCDQLTKTTGNNLGATLTVTASSGGSTTLTCPTAGTASSGAAGSATGLWKSSGTLSVPANTGPVTFDLTWTRSGGGSTFPKAGWETGGNGSTPSQCGGGSNLCKNDFNIVQRVFTGAFDQNSALSSKSGPVAGAALTGATGELMSTPQNAAVNVGVTVDFQALYDQGSITGASFVDVAYGSNQGNGLADCGQGVSSGNGSNGFDVQENAIAGLFTCQNYPVEPLSFTAANCTNATCPGTVPGSKFIKWLDGGLSTRIYACPEANNSTPSTPQNGCATNPLSAAACQAHPNYWSTQNALSDVEANTSDTRLMTVMITDSGNLANGNSSTPVRDYAEFYVTGWTGDPCSGVSISGQSSNGLHYVSDDKAPTDSAGDFFLLGHFIKYFQPGATGSGQLCTLSSIDNCTLVLTK